MGTKKKISLVIIAVFFIIAGVNHFINPDFYFPLIPDYLPFHEVINIMSGICEISFGLAFLIPMLRNYAVYLTIAMLVAFIPSHIHFIVIGSCIGEGLCVPEWIAWVRLIVIHPLLIFWVWGFRSNR